MTVKEAIKEIIKLKGLSIFDDYKIFNAMLLDLGNSNQKEVNIFKNAVDEKILKFCIDNTLGDNQKIAKIKMRLEDKGFSDKTIDFVIDSLGYALSWNYMKMKQILNQTDWTCSCETVNTGNFCSNCGKSKPVPKESSDWTCSCGTVNSGNFCSNCGKSKPVPKESLDWTCSCGTVNTGNFCSNCGKSKPVQKSTDWICSCGTVNKTNFCSNCGKQKENQQSNPFKNAKIGDFVEFGNYPQTANGDILPIEWQVLSKENNKILVISKYGLEENYFDSSSNNDWEDSEIRKWLNGEFYNKAFNEKEKKSIKSSNLSDVGTTDNVFLLSGDKNGNADVNKYFANDESRKCKATEYVVKNGSAYLNSNNGYSGWWLRSIYPDYSNCVYTVSIDGSIKCGPVGYVPILVRPALWINLDCEQDFLDLKDDPSEQLSNCNNQPQRQNSVNSNSFGNVKVRDIVKFGNYPQSANGGNQPIEWQVLSKENNKMLVISKYGLDCKIFDSSSNNWRNSEIRKWLNGEFYNRAFNEKEKISIKSSNLSDVGTADKVFLLSGDWNDHGDVHNYFFNNESRKCKATDYAVKNGAYVNSDNGYSVWWLRSPSPNNSDIVYYVFYDGDVCPRSVCDARFVVRPALWIRINI